MAEPLTGETKGDRVRLVKSSGDLMASAVTRGRIGALRLRGNQIRVSVYPAGLVIRSLLTGEQAILGSEISAVNDSRRSARSGIELVHSGVGPATPVYLYEDPDGPVAQAIRYVAANPVPVAMTPPAISRPDAPSSPTDAIAYSRTAPAPSAGAGTGRDIVGIVAGLALLVLGLVWAIPQLGVSGIVWALVGAFVAASSGLRLLRKLRG